MSLQSLVGISLEQITTTFGIDSQTLVRLDKLRRQRNLTEYTGDLVPESAVGECLAQAKTLQAAALKWLKENRSALL